MNKQFTMKNRFLLALLALGLVFMASCGGDDDDEPAPVSPIVGEWILDLIAYNNFPTGFINNNGQAFLPQEFGIEEWTINFMADGTYEQEIRVPGPNETSSGTYTYEGEDLELSPDDFEPGDQTDFIVENLDDDELTLSFDVNVIALPDAVTDTLTQGLTDAQFDSLAVTVQARLFYYFEK